MPSNPLTQEEINEYAIGRILNPSGYTGLSPYMPQGYFLSTPALGDGPALWRLFDASFISTGIINPDRLGTGATNLGNLYLADDGTWKNIGGGGGGDMLKATYDIDDDGVVDAAETIRIIVRNSTGSTLTKGKVVYLSGATGNRPNALLAQANSEMTSSKTIGIVVSNIPNNSDGYVAVSGTLHDLDTFAFADGDAVWLSPTVAGDWTTTVPSEPNHSVFIGYIARSHPSQGRLVIAIQNGYELNELHNVVAPSPLDNDLLRYNNTAGYWENQSIASIFGGTPLVSVPTLAQVTTAGNTTTNAITVGGLKVIDTANVGVQITNGNATGSGGRGTLIIGESTANGRLQITVDTSIDTANFNYTYAGLISFSTGSVERMRIARTTGNVLINTTTDAGYKLDVNGTVRIKGTGTTSATTAFTVTNSAAAYNSLIIRDDGTFVFANPNNGTAYLSAASNGNITATYFNAGLDVGAGRTITSPYYVASGTVTASSAIARSMYMSTTLVAAANNDVLVGLDINPTFTLGAFTGVSRVGARIQNGALLIGTTLLNTDTISFPLQINGSSQNIGSIFRNALSTGYTSFRFYNDQNSGLRAMEMGYAGSAYPSAILTGGVTGESAYLTSTGAYPLQLGTNNTARFIIFSNGNVAINTATDAGYKLDVNGTGRYVGMLNVWRNGTTAGFVLSSGSNDTLQWNNGTLDIQVNPSSPSTILRLTNAVGGVSYLTSKININAPNVISNLGASLGVYGNIITSGSITAATALAQGVYFNNTLVAAANNDVLVGLDINPTYTKGAFTGVLGYGLRITSPNTTDAALRLVATEAIYAYSAATRVSFNIDGTYGQLYNVRGLLYIDQGANSDMIFRTNAGSERMRIFAAGNVAIGTTTDIGYTLNVNGTARVAGNTVVAGNMGIGSSAGIIAPTLFVYGAKGSFGTFSDTVAGFKSTGNTYISIDSDSGNDTGVQYVSNGVTNWVLLNSRSLGGFASYSTAFGYTSIIKDNGNFLIGTTTDTGEKLQVNGVVRATSFSIGATAGWTGTITIVGNPPGQQNIQVQGGIITNVT